MRRTMASLAMPIDSDESAGRVLYVDDDTFAAALLRATLEDAGFDVRWTSDARAALDAAATKRYDAYLLGAGSSGANYHGLPEKLAAIDVEGRFVVVADCQMNVPPWLDVCILERRDMPRSLVATMETASTRLGRAA